ncbi:hypothetical protein KX729_27680 [Rhizobium sp. XQZ8]|uniref:hypothetical protein n=1 Tax=Rhizobium populisoli TaxID=2859785 RepID=UPI001CA5124D|nr:hypothetical protein [Rhizobium populisoli]MBW6425219.1 hypothetical protein [Rhizobium populisoli]
MRKIEIFDDVRLRFPGRDEEFDLGIEVGAVCVLMAQGQAMIRRALSEAAVDQLRPIADRLDYTITATSPVSGICEVSFSPKSRRPLLRLV